MGQRKISVLTDVANAENLTLILFVVPFLFVLRQLDRF